MTIVLTSRLGSKLQSMIKLLVPYALRTFAAVAGPGLTAVCLKIFAKHGPWGVGLSLLIATVVSAIATELQTSWKKVPRFREYLDPRAAFEGYWIQRFRSTQAPNSAAEGVSFSIAQIFYDGAHDDYVLQGKGYDKEGQMVSHFESTSLKFTGVSVFYGWSENATARGEKSQRKLVGEASITLQSHNNNVGGSGTLQHETDQQRRAFDMIKITKPWLKELLGASPSTTHALLDFEQQIASAFAKKRLSPPALAKSGSDTKKPSE